MSLAFIGLGSNIGDGRDNLREAWLKLGNTPGINLLAISSPYQTRPITKKDWIRKDARLSDQWFTNAVGVLETQIPPRELLAVMKDIELDMGRNRHATVNRPIDLDLLYFDDLILSSAELTLPHSELHKRLFVLAPLEELAPEHEHPVRKLSTTAMRRMLPGSSTGDARKREWKEGPT